MAQYDPLRVYLLSKCKDNELTLTFKEIDNIIAPKALPPYAYNPKGSFWGNSTRSPGNKHVWAFAWYDAGWKVKSKGVDFQLQKVTFCRRLNEYKATP